MGASHITVSACLGICCCASSESLGGTSESRRRWFLAWATLELVEDGRKIKNSASIDLSFPLNGSGRDEADCKLCLPQTTYGLSACWPRHVYRALQTSSFHAKTLNLLLVLCVCHVSQKRDDAHAVALLETAVSTLGLQVQYNMVHDRQRAGPLTGMWSGLSIHKRSVASFARTRYTSPQLARWQTLEFDLLRLLILS